MKVIVLANNSCTNDARIIRSARAAADAGHEVVVLAHASRGVSSDETRDGVRYLRFGWTSALLSHRKISAALAHLLGRTGYILAFNVIHFTRPGIALKPNLVHANDLYTLLAGWRIARATGARLIYDSHELELGRNLPPSLLNDRATVAVAERFLIKRADAVITVSDTIADYLTTRYSITRPTVIHNAPSAGSAVSPVDVRTSLRLTPDIPLAVYIGGVTFNRGLENIVRAMALMPALHVALVGPRSHEPTITSLRRMAKQMGVSDRLHFVDPLPHDEVTSFVRTADVSLALIQDVCLSYRYSFPNKLLESIFAGVPVVASQLPEYESLILKSGAGVTVDQTSPSAIAAAIQSVVQNRSSYVPSDETLRELRREFGPETQMRRLLAVYRSAPPAHAVPATEVLRPSE